MNVRGNAELYSNGEVDMSASLPDKFEDDADATHSQVSSPPFSEASGPWKSQSYYNSRPYDYLMVCGRMIATWKLVVLTTLIITLISFILAGTVPPGPEYSKSCRDIETKQSGIYIIQPDSSLPPFQTYCDMQSAEGGWTLVAAVHENNIEGKCTLGDKWSSEQGNPSNMNSYQGAGNWDNFNTFGDLVDLTYDDYKNMAYYSVKASDVMIWHVPNQTPLNELATKAFLQYYTDTQFLNKFGWSMQSLFKNHAILEHPGFSRFNLLIAEPIKFLRGSNEQIMAGIPTDLKDHVTPGFVQFRAYGTKGYPIAVCPGIKILSGNAASVCFGSSGVSGTPSSYCSDYSGWDGAATDTASDIKPSDTGKSLRDINSTILFFTR